MLEIDIGQYRIYVNECRCVKDMYDRVSMPIMIVCVCGLKKTQVVDIDNEDRSLTNFDHMINNCNDKRHYIPLPMFLLCGWSNMKQSLTER